MKNLAIIAALSENRVIGRDNKLPWHLQSDLRRFQQITLGHTVVMGRKTHESILERLEHPLPNRRSIVITRQKAYAAPDCDVRNDIESVFREVSSNHGTQYFIIGGETIFSHAIPMVNTMHLTVVHTTCRGDAFFPNYGESNWDIKRECFVPRNDRNEYDSTFRTLLRRSS